MSKVIPYPLKEFMHDLKHDEDCRKENGKRPKRPNLRFALASDDSSVELQVLSFYTDGKDLWIDLARRRLSRAPKRRAFRS